jgi:hypothetical protein
MQECGRFGDSARTHTPLERADDGRVSPDDRTLGATGYIEYRQMARLFTLFMDFKGREREYLLQFDYKILGGSGNWYDGDFSTAAAENAPP